MSKQEGRTAELPLHVARISPVVEARWDAGRLLIQRRLSPWLGSHLRAYFGDVLAGSILRNYDS